MFLHCSYTVQDSVVIVEKELDKQTQLLLRRVDQSSYLIENDYSSMTSFSWSKILEEMKTRHPILLRFLLAVCSPNTDPEKIPESMAPVLGMVYAILMQKRWHELSLVQRVISILLSMEHTHQKVQNFIK